ncbi:expansin-A16-like [Malania oleifera]|uniref:expansin-A16-like n=1 Tax=Malania oleifera TaxID=397392 RepID=UPI0025AE4C4C|nr:expansin-A16-like [Malania oleifera]
MVTATKFGPPNPSKPNDNGGWYSVLRAHFDLSKPTFQKIAKFQAGMVPVSYRRTSFMRRNWGQNWQASSSFHGETLSFTVTTSDGRHMIAWNVIPSDLAVAYWSGVRAVREERMESNLYAQAHVRVQGTHDRGLPELVGVQVHDRRAAAWSSSSVRPG